ncbi:MAG TPA: segregation/condensation protein A [Phycisphaerae bacterium]|nr:segregation/condensation protein A [Phycisphaerae bacterium]
MNDYRVQTDIYSGPMELLLFLIKRDEIDLYDIPVSRICEQYLQYVEMLQVIDPNVAGEFLILATVLMELKSRSLLPRAPADDGEIEDDPTDPRLELVRQLLEYKKFKDASLELQNAADQHARRWPRIPAKPLPANPAEVDLEDVQIWDLVAAFNRVMASIGAGAATHDVVFDDTPISLHAADIIDRLEREGGGMRFEDVFAGRRKAEMIGLFLALLELMRQARVRVAQSSNASSIQVELLSSEPISIGAEWGAAFESAVLGEAPLSADSTTSSISTIEIASEAQERHDRESSDGATMAFGIEFDEDLDEARVAELDAIRTEVDIDQILRAPGSDDNA